MRNIQTVIDQIVGQIPEDESWTSLREDLQGIKGRSRYVPPEQVSLKWQRLGDVLGRHLRDVDEPWTGEISRIMAG